MFIFQQAHLEQTQTEAVRIAALESSKTSMIQRKGHATLKIARETKNQKFAELQNAIKGKEDPEAYKTIFASNKLTSQFKEIYLSKEVGGLASEFEQLARQYNSSQHEKLSMAMLRGMSIKKSHDDNEKSGLRYAQAQLEKSKEDFGAPKTDQNYG